MLAKSGDIGRRLARASRRDGSISRLYIFKFLSIRHAHVAIESYFELLALFQSHIAVGQDAGERAQAGAGSRSNACSLAAPCDRAGGSAHGSADCGRFNGAVLGDRFALDLAFFADLTYGVLS